MILVLAVACLAGCQSPPPANTANDPLAGAAEHSRLFGNFQLPRQIGYVENRGPQLPVVSPDGSQILYLLVEAETISPMTLLGSTDPADTPPEGTLAIWIRPLEGTARGRRLSRQRWAHSPAWSPTGRSVAYVSNEAGGSAIVYLELDGGRETKLGVPGAVNCLPRFDGDDRTLLFCSGPTAAGPFRVYRQAINESAPAPLTPEGQDCLLPVLTDDAGRVVCAVAEQEQMHWILASERGSTDLSAAVGELPRAATASLCAGVAEPASPDGKSFLFYDAFENRITACAMADRRLARHRTGSIAACWIDQERFALATPENLFVVNAFSGVSLPLMSGAWIPARYVPESRTLIVLGKGPSTTRLTLYRIVFEPPAAGGLNDKEKRP